MSVTDLRPPFTIGGSDAAAACGLDPFRSRIMLCAEKLGLVAREPTEAMRWGTILEPVIVDALRGQGYIIAVNGPTVYDGTRPWMIGHPDGFAEVADLDYVLLEVKTAGIWGAHDWQDNGAPARYVLQVQHYLHLTGLDRALLAVLIGGQRLELRTVERDDELIAAMIEAETETYGYLVRGELPAPDGSDSGGDVLRALHPEAVSGKTAQLDGAAWQAFRDLKLWREAEDRAKAKRAELEQIVKAAMGDADVALSPGGAEVARWQNVSAARIDTTRLKAEAPHVAATFTETTTTRRFTLA